MAKEWHQPPSCNSFEVVAAEKMSVCDLQGCLTHCVQQARLRHLCCLPYEASEVAQAEHNAEGATQTQAFFVVSVANVMTLFARCSDAGRFRKKQVCCGRHCPKLTRRLWLTWILVEFSVP